MLGLSFPSPSRPVETAPFKLPPDGRRMSGSFFGKGEHLLFSVDFLFFKKGTGGFRKMVNSRLPVLSSSLSPLRFKEWTARC